eukprot:GFUD01019687.1.p1 GENE.GFUD01019687.1~~GFUD01019687.1.p1  ORF type:complete len:263 (-),score=78.70 GFUD01019687.1:56-844(-)
MSAQRKSSRIKKNSEKPTSAEALSQDSCDDRDSSGEEWYETETPGRRIRKKNVTLTSCDVLVKKLTPSVLEGNLLMSPPVGTSTPVTSLSPTVVSVSVPPCRGKSLSTSPSSQITRGQKEALEVNESIESIGSDFGGEDENNNVDNIESAEQLSDIEENGGQDSQVVKHQVKVETESEMKIDPEKIVQQAVEIKTLKTSLKKLEKLFEAKEQQLKNLEKLFEVKEQQLAATELQLKLAQEELKLRLPRPEKEDAGVVNLTDD